MIQQIQPTRENEYIISEVLKQEIKTALESRKDSAQKLLEEI